MSSRGRYSPEMQNITNPQKNLWKCSLVSFKHYILFPELINKSSRRYKYNLKDLHMYDLQIVTGTFVLACRFYKTINVLVCQKASLTPGCFFVFSLLSWNPEEMPGGVLDQWAKREALLNLSPSPFRCQLWIQRWQLPKTSRFSEAFRGKWWLSEL